MRRLAAVWGVLLACGPSAPAPGARTFVPGPSCKVLGSAFGAATLGDQVVVSEFELDRVAQLRLSDCTEQRHWDVPGGPRAVSRFKQDFLAVAGSRGLTLARLTGGISTLDLSPAPNALLVADGQIFATTGATSDDARVVQVTEQREKLNLDAELPLTGASALALAGPDLVAARYAERKVTVLDRPNGRLAAGPELPSCSEPFAVTAYQPTGGAPYTVVTTCRTGGLSVLSPTDAGYEVHLLARDGTLYDTVAVDLDLDGRIDLAGVDPFAHRLVFWWGAADGGFEPPVERATDRGPILLRTFDFDTDGRPELLVLAFADRSVTVYRNEGTSR